MSAPQEAQLPEIRSRSSFYYYNPYEKRVIEVPLTNFDAFVSLLKCVIGTGILAMPLAFRCSGIVAGALLSVVLMIMFTYSIHLLIMGMTECCRRIRVPQVSMPEAIQIAYELGPDWVHCFANAAGLINSCALVIGQFGLCTVYLVFVAKNFKEIGDYYWHSVSERYYVLVGCVVLLPMVMIPKLKYLVPLNLLSNVLLYSGFACIMYYLVRGLPSIADRHMVQHPSEWTLFFGIAAFSFTSVGSMLVVEANMAHPQEYLGTCGVLNLAVIFILFSNVFFGIMGYWRYGDKVEASVTLNISQGEIVSQLVKGAIASGIFLSYPMNAFVATTVIFSDYVNAGVDAKKRHSKEYVARFFFLLGTGFVAAVVPDLAALTALEGAFSLSNLNLFCPAVIDAFLNYDVGYGKLRWKLVRDITIMLVAVIFGVFGCTVAIQHLIEDFKLTLRSMNF